MAGARAGNGARCICSSPCVFHRVAEYSVPKPVTMDDETGGGWGGTACMDPLVLPEQISAGFFLPVYSQPPFCFTVSVAPFCRREAADCARPKRTGDTTTLSPTAHYRPRTPIIHLVVQLH